MDALFMELLSIARPAPDTRAAELRRSRGFALGAYAACLARIEKLYLDVLRLTQTTAGEGAETEEESGAGEETEEEPGDASEGASAAESAARACRAAGAAGAAGVERCEGTAAERPGGGDGGAREGEASSGAMVAPLPPPLSAHLYMCLLSCRFDVEDPAAPAWCAPSTCRLLRETLQPALGLSDAEHHACMVLRLTLTP